MLVLQCGGGALLWMGERLPEDRGYQTLVVTMIVGQDGASPPQRFGVF
jgi:hypothetical protein